MIPQQSDLLMSPELCCYLQRINDFVEAIKNKVGFDWKIRLITIQFFEYLIRHGDYLIYEIDYNAILSSIQNATNGQQIIQIFRDGQVST